MITHELQQGGKEWLEYRAKHFNASDAPAMLGIGPYKTRNQLLHEKATNIMPDIDAATQRRFNDGHRFEELARPLAEKVIGQELFPVVGSEGKLSASFDGLTMDESICWEHKLGSAKLLESLRNGIIPDQYHPQMEQQLMLSGAERCLFSATLWNDADELVEEEHAWYSCNMELRDRIIHGWEQFEKDLTNYAPAATVEKPVAESILNLPALSVQATGMVTYSNLPEFKAAADSYITNINTDLQTDQQFSDAEATVKFCKATEETLEVTKKAILAQTATIDEVIRTVDHIQAQLRDKRILLNKLVTSEKEARKAAIVQTVRMLFNDFVLELETETKPIRLIMPMPVFAEAIKGLKKLSAMQEAVDTMLRDSKFAAEQIAKDVRAKLSWCKEHAAGMSFLFPDLQQIITKPMEDFTLTISSRIKDHKEAEARKEAEIHAKAEADAAAKLEADRAQMRAEEEAKAKAAQDVLLATEREKMEAEVKAEAERQAIDAAEQRAHEKSLAGEPHVLQPVIVKLKPAGEVVIEHQAEIAAFMASRDFGKEAGKVRAILVEFVKFTSTRSK